MKLRHIVRIVGLSVVFVGVAVTFQNCSQTPASSAPAQSLSSGDPTIDPFTQSTCTANSAQACNITNGSGFQTCAASGTGWGACQVSQCNTGYNQSGNTCVTAAVTSQTSTLTGCAFQNVNYKVGNSISQLCSNILGTNFPGLAGNFKLTCQSDHRMHADISGCSSIAPASASSDAYNGVYIFNLYMQYVKCTPSQADLNYYVSLFHSPSNASYAAVANMVQGSALGQSVASLGSNGTCAYVY